MIRWTMIGLSLVLALAAGAVWAVTVWGPQRAWEWTNTHNIYSKTIWSVNVAGGGIDIHRGRFLGCGWGLTTERMGVAGFQYARRFYVRAKPQTAERSLRVPHWASVLLFSAYPVAALLGSRARLRRRRVRGLCVDCGYDLTGNVSGVCPECSTGIERAMTWKHAGRV